MCNISDIRDCFFIMSSINLDHNIIDPNERREWLAILSKQLRELNALDYEEYEFCEQVKNILGDHFIPDIAKIITGYTRKIIRVSDHDVLADFF